MAPTKEQQEIIDTPLEIGESLMVEAGAGTGKTACMIEISKAHPNHRILYICFNSKSAIEARNRYARNGVRNTHCSTIHGLASQTKKRLEEKGKFQTKVTVKDIQKRIPCETSEAYRILNGIKAFCESGDETLSGNHLPPHTPDSRKTLQGCQTIWAAMTNIEDPFPVAYDHYLKIYALQKPRLPYDFILLDESQDSNPLTLQIVENQRKYTRTILIGDVNQAIYGWRGAKNAMESWNATKTKPLTESFRFGPEIAKTANIILQTYKKGRVIKGHKPEDSLGKVDPSKQFTLIARTNATLLEKALEGVRAKEKFHFVGTTKEEGWNPSRHYKFDDAKDVYQLYMGKRDAIKNPHIRAFDSYQELAQIAKGGPTWQLGRKRKSKLEGDKELEALCKLVEKYNHQLPPLLDRIIEFACGPKEAAFQLVSAHRSKGLEWDQVKLGEDFCPLITPRKQTDPPGTPAIRLTKPRKNETGPTPSHERETGEIEPEEYNLLYVAITRAKSRLEPNQEIRQLLKFRHLLDQELEIPEEQPLVETKTPPKKSLRDLLGPEM